MKKIYLILKKIVKKIVTHRQKEFIKKSLQKFKLRRLVNNDRKRFSKNAAFSLYDDSYEQLSARIMYNVHAIEKGLSRTHEFRAGFGKSALSALNDSLVLYEKKEFSKELFPYIEGRSIFLKYITLHREMGVNTDFMKNIVNSEYLNESLNYVAAGVKEIYLKDKLNNKEKNFYELAQGRSSVRDFSGEKVNKKDIFRAIQNATKTPSVCNRQGWKIYLVEDKKKIEKLLELQKGLIGYPKLPEVVLTIAISNKAFLDSVERNEVFIDGGLFAMSVIYGLEYEGLAAVTLNAMMNPQNEKGIRDLLGVNEAEQIILFIAVGQFKESTIVPISDRKTAESFTKVI